MLQTDHLILRAPEPHDLPLMYEWENNAAYWLLSDTIKPYSRYTLNEFIKHDQENITTERQQRFVIELKHPLKAIGLIDLYAYDPIHRRAGVGILIGDEAERNHGYALQSLECLMHYARHTLNLHQLYCYIQTSNKTSATLFSKAGFSNCGILKDWLISNQQPQDVMLCQRIL
jgi:diamine N-acetyltransferase